MRRAESDPYGGTDSIDPEWGCGPGGASGQGMRPGRGNRVCSTYCSPGGVSRWEAPAVLETIVRKRLPHRRWGCQEWSWFTFVTGGAGNHLGEEADKTAVEDLKLPSFGEKLAVEERVKSKDPPVNESVGKGDGAEELIPFIVGESLPVVPAKVVKKILRGEFVDMEDLRKDNLEAERRRYSQKQERGHTSCGQTPYYREGGSRHVELASLFQPLRSSHYKQVSPQG